VCKLQLGGPTVNCEQSASRASRGQMVWPTVIENVGSKTKVEYEGGNKQWYKPRNFFASDDSCSKGNVSGKGWA